jgi:hypothetical protein
MSDEHRRPEKPLGVFLAPDGIFAIPLRNLSDEIPEGDPAPERLRSPKRRSWIRRLIARVVPEGADRAEPD